MTSVATVGFIGLGEMGSPMAANLAEAGFRVTGYDVGRDGMERLAAAGGRPGDSVAEATVDADAVITMLPGWLEVEDVVLGEDGVLDYAKPGLLCIDMSTVRPETPRRIATIGACRNLRVLDAPAGGDERAAIDGVLSIVVGGDPEDVAAAMPLFDVLADTTVHVGPLGAGQTVRAANQLVVGGTCALIAEAVALLKTSDVDTDTALDVLAGGLAGSRVLELGRASPGRGIDLRHPDMDVVLTAAREARLALPVAGLLAQLFTAARAQATGPPDHSALLRVVQNLSGRRDRGTD